jgi:transposase
MSGHVAGFCRNQGLVLPYTLEEYVDEENPVRFIDAFVDSLDLKRLEFRHSEPGQGE